MLTLTGLQMNTSTDSLALKLLSNFFEFYFFLNVFELHSKCFALHNYGLYGLEAPGGHIIF